MRFLKVLFAFVAVIFFLPSPAFAPPSATLTVQVVPAGSASICFNPPVPHPAQAANFTTLAYCADFTQQSTTNNVFNHTSGIMVWTTVSDWLDCAGASSPQWLLNNNIGQTDNCSDISVANDPISGVNALILNTQTGATHDATAIATGGGGGALTMTYPGTNSYVEIGFRIDSSQVLSNMPIGSGIFAEFWSWQRVGGCIEVDFIEAFASDEVQGFLDWCNYPGTGSGSYTLTGPFDSVYHVIGSLITSNGSSGYMGQCQYIDGSPAMQRSPTAPQTCHGLLPSDGPASYQQMSWLIMANESGTSATATTGPVTLWISYIRVWSCAGWNNGTPSTGTNSCITASPFTGTPP